MTLLDFQNDRMGVLITKAASLPDCVPEWVQHTQIDSFVCPPDEPITYLDSYGRRLPCHTKAAACVSAIYYLMQRGDLDADAQRRIDSKLAEVAKLYDIEAEVRCADQAIKTAAIRPAPSKYAINNVVNGEMVRLLPIDTAAEVRTAAAQLRKYAASYPLVWRRKAASEILKAAQQTDAIINDADLKYCEIACQCVESDPDICLAGLRKRAAALPAAFSNEARQLMKQADAIVNGETVDRRTLVSVLDDLDFRAELRGRYSEGLETPEEICFGRVVKAAQPEQTVSLTTGTTYKLSDLQRADVGVYAAADETLLDEICADALGSDLDGDKLAEVLPTLPRDVASRLDRMLSEAGVRRSRL